MPNTYLNSQIITRKALAIWHQKSNFIGKINRQYDDRFANKGAKIGETLQIRKPNKYIVRPGRVMDVQDTVNTTTALTVATQRGVDLDFTQVDLTMKIEDFAETHLEPAISVLAANVEFEVMNGLYKTVQNEVGTQGSPVNSLKTILNAGRKLDESLAPYNDRCITMNTQTRVNMVDAMKGLFNDQSAVAKQFRSGMIGKNVLGFDWFQNTLLPTHTRGSANANYVVNGAGQTGSSLTVGTGTGTLLTGDVFTIAGVFAIHPETRQSYPYLQQFVVTADYAGGGGNVSIYPAITTTGSYQTVSGSPANGAAITISGTANQQAGMNLAFQKDAFTFVSTDLELPKGMDMAYRARMDNVSMSFVRGYDIINGVFLSRLDILFGFKELYPEWACRIASD